MQNPIIPFIWSAIAFAIGGYLVDTNDIIFKIFGGCIIIFALVASRYLNHALMHIKNSVIYISGIMALFGSVFLVNNVLTGSSFSSAVLGYAAPIIVVSLMWFFSPSD